jgi:hypothetical protein
MVNEAAALRNEAALQLEGVGKGDQSVSTIAWLGYDPPDTTDISVVEAGFERRANEAAPDLAEFYRGINATNEHGSDVHLSAFGHSYGSVATAAFYGSPGLGQSDMTETHVGPRGIPAEVLAPIRDESRLFLADGHAFVMSAPGDQVSGDISLAYCPQPIRGNGAAKRQTLHAHRKRRAVRAGRSICNGWSPSQNSRTPSGTRCCRWCATSPQAPV